MIQLDETGIERALPNVANGLEKYWWLQMALVTTDVSRDRDFQRRFNGFYRVRRNLEWQLTFYRLLERNKLQPQSFPNVLRTLQTETGSVEPSFASKLVASVDPNLPVIDAFVLGNLGLRLSHSPEVEVRLSRAIVLHDHIQRLFQRYLESSVGRHLVTRFEHSYPDRPVTPAKMLDLVLWQTR